MDEVGCVHGRFQLFHNDHLSYVQAAKQMVKFVWIGIAKFDIAASDANPLGRDRDRPENNPLTYFERITMISEALTEAGIRKDEFGFVPFPIETPLRLSEFMPPSIPCYTMICEEWNREKIRVLRAFGYDPIVLWERDQKKIAGGKIREDILAGGTDWKKMVPPSVARNVARLNVRNRLAHLRQMSGDIPPTAT